MSELAGIPADTLEWYTLYLREEANLRAANAVVVNEHHRQPLAQAQGGGTLSSSDGLRLTMRGKSLTARALSPIFHRSGRDHLLPRVRPALHLRHPGHRLHRA